MDITVNNATLLRCLLVYNYTTMKHSYCAKWYKRTYYINSAVWELLAEGSKARLGVDLERGGKVPAADGVS